MQQITDPLQEALRKTSGLAALSRSTTSLQHSEQGMTVRTPDSDRDFKEKMLIVVHDSFEASSQNATLEEMAARAEVWADILFGIIPADRLKDAFKRAVRDQDSAFPVNAYQLKLAYERIQAEEAAEAKRREQEEAELNRTARCPNKYNHVNDGQIAADEGLVAYPDPDDFAKNRIMPCFVCRTTAFDAARARYIESKAGHASPPKAVSDAVNKVLLPDPPPIPETAEEIIGRAYREVKREWEMAVIPAKDEYLKAAQMLSRALDYIIQQRYER